jgi:hypothetical protein
MAAASSPTQPLLAADFDPITRPSHRRSTPDLRATAVPRLPRHERSWHAVGNKEHESLLTKVADTLMGKVTSAHSDALENFFGATDAQLHRIWGRLGQAKGQYESVTTLLSFFGIAKCFSTEDLATLAAAADAEKDGNLSFKEVPHDRPPNAGDPCVPLRLTQT